QSRAPRRGSSLPAFACFLGVWQGPETMAINIESDSEERARHPEARVPHLGRAPRRIARVSKDGHKRDRTSGHPSRRRLAPPHQDEICGFKLHPPDPIGFMESIYHSAI